MSLCKEHSLALLHSAGRAQGCSQPPLFPSLVNMWSPVASYLTPSTHHMKEDIHALLDWTIFHSLWKTMKIYISTLNVSVLHSSFSHDSLIHAILCSAAVVESTNRSPQYTTSSIYTHLYLHWRACYLRELDERF